MRSSSIPALGSGHGLSTPRRLGRGLALALAAALALVAGCGSVADQLPDAAPAPDATPDAPPAAPSIADVLDCGTAASAGGLRPGTDLQRVDLDLAAFPDARCNDGSAGTFFVRPAATPAGASHWVIQLQGGGGCRTPDDCARRWCSVGTNFGMTQMSSALAPATGIPADGILYRGPAHVNPIADANQVFVRYCSSDTWAGRTGPIDLDALHPVTGEPVRFRIDFHGQDILDAVIATLRRDGAAVPAYTLDGGSTELADLDDATAVVLAGASAGGGGTINNADRIGAALRATNTCGVDCALDFIALIDSTFGPNANDLDWTTSTMCTTGGACTWRDVLAAGTAMYPPHGDDSCETWHAANAPDTAYLCNDTDHVIRNHVTTPFAMRMGLRDELISGNAIEAGVSVPGQGRMTLPLFSQLVHDQLLDLSRLPTLAEEGAAITRAPGTFGPPCPDHETLSTNPSVFDVTVSSGGTPYTMFQVFSNWATGATPAQVVYEPGDPIDCM